MHGAGLPTWAVIVFILFVVIAVLLFLRCWLGKPYEIVGGGNFRLKLSEPEYSEMLDGSKTVDPRPARPPFNRIKKGDTITVVRARPQGDTSEHPRYKYDTTVVRVEEYPNFDAMLKKETLKKVYPKRSESDAKAQFAKFLPEGSNPSQPVLAIELAPPKK